MRQTVWHFFWSNGWDKISAFIFVEVDRGNDFLSLDRARYLLQNLWIQYVYQRQKRFKNKLDWKSVLKLQSHLGMRNAFPWFVLHSAFDVFVRHGICESNQCDTGFLIIQKYSSYQSMDFRGSIFLLQNLIFCLQGQMKIFLLCLTENLFFVEKWISFNCDFWKF